MSKYKVISEFIDKVAGLQRQPGDVIEADEERMNRLREAGVIGAKVIDIEPETEEQAPVSNLAEQIEEAKQEAETEESERQEETAGSGRRKARR